MPSPLELDTQFMRRALRLAMNGRGLAEPNPIVGCVIVKNAQIIGEGYHQQYGHPHAEPNALASCTQSPQGATAYVTLEPCCHTNKQTPPCVPKLIEAKLARIVIGCHDPNPNVNGKGAALLRAAGIAVDISTLEPQAKQLIALFITNTTLNRPYVTLKWAQTANGKIAASGGQPLQITNALSRNLVHDLKIKSNGILVGINTILTDDPILNARYAPTPRHPARFILDKNLRTPVSANIVRDKSAPTTIFYSHTTDASIHHRRDQLNANDVRTTLVPTDNSRHLNLSDTLTRIFNTSCHDLLVEPGPTLAASFFRDNLADRIWLFRSPVKLNNPTAPSAIEIPPHYIETGHINLEGDTLTEYLNPQSPVYFTPEPSADLVLAQV